MQYRLTSRMGSPAQFRGMVTTCRAAGVRVYVDAVINHMTGQGNLSYGGASYTKYHYGDLYHYRDFHHAPGDCPSASGNIDDFNSYLQVTKCELVSLSDLRTEKTYVRDRLAHYLNKLIRLGVSGFRVDAAKHVGQADLEAIESRLHKTVDGTRPYVALEVFPGGPGKLSPFAFFGQGDLLGFDTAYQLKSAFKSYTTDAVGDITTLKVFGARAGLLPSRKSLALVENHDTERDGSTLSYKDGATNLLATQFLLASGYGRPTVYSAFDFEDRNASPPSDANGIITDTTCGSGWTCVDRATSVANMVGWHNHVAGTPRRNWYDDGVNLIAFSRGHKGWISINNNTTAVTRSFRTGLPAGRYCDIIHGDYSRGSCSGPTVMVNDRHRARVTVGGKDSVAFDSTDIVTR